MAGDLRANTGSGPRWAALGVLAALLLSACAPTTGPGAGPPVSTSGAPVIERTDGARRSDSEQREGDKLHPEVLKRFGGVYENAALTAHVNRIGKRLADVSPQAGEKWTFTVLDSETVNAFAIPGGYVYVTRGLVALAADEAELAGVVGHEIAHVTAGHGARRETRSTAATAGLLIGSIGLAALGISPPVVGDILQTAVGGVLASYSRDDEREADRIGVAYLADAGYDPTAQADFLEALAANASLDAELAGQEFDPERTGFFATHPATAGRSRQAREIGLRFGVEGERAPERHLAAIDGMSYGPAAAQGILASDRFLHAPLNFGFDIPRDHQVSNRPSAVLTGARDGSRMIFDSAAAEGRGPEAFIRDDWVPAIKRSVRAGTLQRLEPRRIDGAPAARALLPVELNGKRFTALLVAIRRDDRYYRFTGLAPQGVSLTAMADAADSFSRLTGPERREARQRRIEVVRAGRGDTAETLARRMDVEEGKLERFRLLNDLEPGEPIAPGQPVKLVR